MPSRHLVRVDLDQQPDTVMPWHLHAVVCSWIEAGDPGHQSGVKPFTVSPLRDDGDGGWGFEISLLDDRLEGRLVDAVVAASHGLKLGELRSRVLPWPEGPVRPLGRKSWEELATIGRDVHTFGLEFLTPTAFRHHRTAVPLPIPGLVFGHFRARWAAFAPKHLAPEIDFQGLDLRVDHLRIETAQVAGRHHDQVGFVGEVRLATGRGSPADRRWLDRLAGLATFAGTGSGTTMGMGVTRYTTGRILDPEVMSVSRPRAAAEWDE